MEASLLKEDLKRARVLQIENLILAEMIERVLFEHHRVVVVERYLVVE